MNTKQAKSIALSHVQDYLDRCGGECLITVRNLAKKVAQELEIECSLALNHLADEVLYMHAWAEFWGYGRRVSGGAKQPVSARIYKVRERTVADIAAAANLEVAP